MKILELIDAYYPNFDGAINVADNYVKKLSEKEDCKIAVPKPSRKSGYKDKSDFEVIRCNSGWAPEGYRNALPETDEDFKKRIEKEDFDIFHAHSPFGMGRFAVKMARKKHIPVVLTLHTKYHLDFKRSTKSILLTKFMLKVIMWTYNHADSVWTVSEESKNVLRSYGYKGDIDVVRNGTDYKYPENANELRDKVIKKHNLDTNNAIFLFVGRMSYYKNIKLIAKACKILKDRGINFTMLFVGGGFDLDSFKKFVSGLGVSDKVIFTDTINDRELLQGYYLASDVLVFPSTFDTSGVVKVEAAAHKKPALLIEGSCAGEEVIEGENGYLCNENIRSIARAMENIAKSKGKLNFVGENAYKTLYRSWDMIADEVLKKYNKIIEDYKKTHKNIK